ncbi:MAG: C25 family cysteine peptidase [Thermoanaerobaculia bacterium]
MLRRLSAAVVCVCIGLTTPLFGGSTGTTALHMPQGSTAGTANGDFVSDDTVGALNTFYRYFIEVPAGTTKVAVDLYDADIGLSAGEAVLGRDRNRGTYDSSVTYSLFNPAGTAVNTRFTTGNNAGPVGADGAWLNFFTGTGNNVFDQFGTNAYTNNNGNNNWTGNWIENDGGGGGATGGAILVTGGQLRIGDGVAGIPDIYREADLLGTPGLNMGMAYLRFDYTTSANLEASDQVSVQISNNGGASYTTLETFSDDSTGTRSYDITAFIANNTRVRFLVAGGLGGTEFFFFDNVQISDGPITAGHWELQVDMAAVDDINAIGIRAHDGDATSGGTELNVYADSMVSLGVNPDGAGGNSRSYTLYPWVTSGCTATQNDFDRDSDGGDVGSVTYTSRTAAFTQTFTSATLSIDDAWNRDNISNYTSNFFANDYGIWTQASTINTYINTSGNYETMYVGNYLAPANPPTTNPMVSGGFPATSRIYLPTDAGTAPVKPWLEQYLTRVGGSGPAPAIGVPQAYTVTVVVRNPTAHAITFSALNLVVANVPGAGTVYAGSPTISQGAITGAPAIGGTGNVSWNPGVVAAGGTALLAYNVTVTPVAATTAATGTPASGNGTRATYVDETGNTTQARATYRLGGLCNLNVVVGLATEVMLASFDVDDRGHVAWATASEAGTVGFNLYREDGSKVNDALIPAGRGHYEIDDRAMAQRYILEEITASGKVFRHGPVASMHRIGPDADKTDHRAVRLKASADANVSTDAAKTVAVMAGVRETGIVRVPFTELAARFGTTAANIAKNAERGQLSVKTGGESVAHTATADAILFFGEKSDSIYSAERVYRIEQEKGLLMANVAAGASNASLSVFDGQANVETDAFPATVLPLDPESDYWFWDYLISGDPTLGRKTFTVTVPDVAETSGATLEVRLQGALANAFHGARVKVNGVPVGELTWSSLEGKTSTLALPAGVLIDGANQVEIEGTLAPSAAFDIFYVDGFTVRYKRFARPVDGAIEARLTNAITAGPFTNAPVVLDITKRLTPTLLTGGSLAGGNVSMALPATTKSVFAADQFITPASYRSAADASLKTPRADYIVIAPASMRSGAGALASLRQAEGMKTLLVDLEQIYDEFSHGMSTPHAIRAFVATAMKSSQKPQYIVLAGSGTVDYRGIAQSPGAVPPLMIKTADGLFASDVKLAEGVAVGRIPVTNNADLLAYVEKLRDHSASANGNPIIFTADVADGETNFGAASDEAAQPLETRPHERFHIGELGAQATRDALLNRWTSGTPLVSWIGHGGLDQLGASGILTAGDAPSLLAPGRLPVLVAMTCTINRFEIGVAEPLGTALTRQADGGALAVWSATGLSNHEHARELQRTFMRLASARPELRVGDLVLQTLSAHPSDTAGIYVLLGDPAVTMQLPKEMTNGGTRVPSGE